MSRTVAKPPAIFSVLLVGAFLLTVTAGVEALSGGIFREDASAEDVDLSVQGCQCHNPTMSEDVMVDLDAPNRYESGQTYEIGISFTGGPEAPGVGSNNGGFNLLVTGGELAAPEGEGANWVQVNPDHNEATHTNAGVQESVRNFTVMWTAPETHDAVMFVLTVNSVDGNGAPTPDDQWGQVAKIVQHQDPEFAVEEALGGGAKGQEINKIGVHYLAYWVGVISFAVLFVMYGLTFFLFRFNESGNATDHKDRAK